MQTEPTNDNNSKKMETFENLLQRSLNNRSNSRPPKIEISGTLIPVQSASRQHCDFKLNTGKVDISLRMGSALESIAKYLAWDDVAVRGQMDMEDDVFEVEKITPLPTHEQLYRFFTASFETETEINEYQKKISRQGKLELERDFLAS